ncbi:hypothetical protein [Marinobacterium iners]|uniref:Uncharacterized protein n=1 Tax=Marinobacterium iners DSM 11526 TaxID=1122198 RepID=A0A1H4H1A3_9GAMM|nr:hypothetical protein [Marinobacterium iners]SEB14782.1 hypothetical protein SAMN02745729_1232 [Marinobacterium iners DSM 11526]
MSKADSELFFSVLLERVLHCWPKSIDVKQLHADKSRPDLYVVSGLGAMGDSIAEGFDDEIDAVLVTVLCDAVTSTIRSAALFCTEIEPALLRPDTVRENFEKRLHRAETNPDLGWKKEDILLIRRYFFLNNKRCR